MPFLGLSTASYLAISSILLASAKGMFVISVMLLGRTIVDAMKAGVKRVFKSAFSQQKPIGYKRYLLGIIMFFASLIYPTVITEMILIFDKVKQVGELNMILILFSGDLIFIASFFVLGTDFITKLKSTFKYRT